MVASGKAALRFWMTKRVWAAVKAGAIWKLDVAKGRGAGTTVLAKPVGEAQVGVVVVVVFWG